MEEQLQRFLLALGDIEKGLQHYSQGRRDAGSRIADAALRELERLLGTPVWAEFCLQISEYIASVELVELGGMERIKLAEAGLLKKYGLSARELLQLQRLYALFKKHGEASELAALFAAPDTLLRELAGKVALIKAEIDSSRARSRKVKKMLKSLAASRVTQLLAGSALIAANCFWKKDEQTSVSIGMLFLGAALKK